MREFSTADIIQNTEVFTIAPKLSIRLLRLSGPWCEDDSGAFAEETFPYWLFAWGSGQALTRYLFEHPELVRGRTVLDFGAGCGLASIAAARCGAARVIAMELDPNALTACRLNAALNDVVIEPVLSQSDSLDLTDCDVLLAGDVFFHWAENNSVLTAADGPSEILVATPLKRGFVPNSEFPMERLRKLVEYEVKTVPTIERADIKHVAVYCRAAKPPEST
jgi:predicted nicotinamide N-methyase